MDRDVTQLIKQIERDIINYITLHSIEFTPKMIEAAVNDVVQMTGISLGEDKYLHQDVVDAVKNNIK